MDDVLDRRKKFSWKAFGGDGFLVSVAFHVMLAIIALFYIVSRYQAPKTKTDPEVFATGAGGGQNGDKPKAFEQKLKTNRTNVKMPARIVSKSAGAISLPDTPQTSTASFANGLTSGGMSKGSGGGTGGGEGTGIGIGKGGGKNFVSLFGARGAGARGLPGTFYDLKQTAAGQPSKYKDDATVMITFDQVVRKYVRDGNAASLEKFFKGPETLMASWIFIPNINADTAPSAFGLQNVPGKRWMVTYRGEVVAPKSGKFRFWGLGDDAMAVRWGRKLVLDGGWVALTFPGTGENWAAFANKAILGVTETKKGAMPPPFRAGPWITVQKGDRYPLEIIITECYGGLSGFWLLMEQADENTGKGDGKLFLFRMTDDAIPDGLKDETGLSPDMTGKGLIWNATPSKTLVR